MGYFKRATLFLGWRQGWPCLQDHQGTRPKVKFRKRRWSKMNRIKTTKYILVTFLLTCIFMWVFETTGHTGSRVRHQGYYGFRYNYQGRSTKAFKQLDRSDRRTKQREIKHRFERDFDRRPDRSGSIKPRFGPDRPAPRYHFMTR